MNINGRQIGSDQPPFVIAEMSGNHNQSLDRALELVEAAAKAGAHAIKLQTYTADTMTLNIRSGDFVIDDPNSLWYGRTLYDLYEEAHTPWEWHEPIFARCRELGIICFSTPFDFTAVEFLENLQVPCYKIASFENTDLPLIRRVAQTGKPLLISTGLATETELEEMVRTVRHEGCDDLILLKCTSAYPASPEAANLRTIADIRNRFKVQVGLSDHTLGLAVPLAAVACGATVIEKHFTLSRADGGVDAAFSLEPDELAELVVESERAWQAMGQVSYKLSDKEKQSCKFRRSLYIVEDLKAGEPLTEKNVRAIRPGGGLPPGHLDEVIGRTMRVDVVKGTPLNWKLLD